MREQFPPITINFAPVKVIGIPGLALVWAAHELGLSASLQVVDYPDVWYRIPYLLMSAFQNGLSEAWGRKSVIAASESSNSVSQSRRCSW